jgi:hypothetical protein
MNWIIHSYISIYYIISIIYRIHIIIIHSYIHILYSYIYIIYLYIYYISNNIFYAIKTKQKINGGPRTPTNMVPPFSDDEDEKFDDHNGVRLNIDYDYNWTYIQGPDFPVLKIAKTAP